MEGVKTALRTLRDFYKSSGVQAVPLKLSSFMLGSSGSF